MTDQTDYSTKPSGARRVITWLLIAVLGAVVALEFRGMMGYQKTLTAYEDALDASRGEMDESKQFTVAKAKELGAYSPAFATSTGEYGPEVEVKWFSPLSFVPGRDWRIHLSVAGDDDTAGVMSLTTAGDRAEAEAMRPKKGGGAKVVKVNAPPPPTEQEKMTSAALTSMLGDEAVMGSLGLSDDLKGPLAELQEEIKKTSEEVKASASQPAEVGQLMTGMQSGWNVKLKNIIGEDAITRLMQIELQKAGKKAALRPEISKLLGLSGKQMQDANDDADKLMESMTDEQKSKWQELLGEAFDAAE